MVVYLTVNLINGKKYIGADSKNNPQYLGSGDFIKKAIKKYGKENFKKEILEVCNSWEELMKCEEKWCLKFDVKTNPTFYNCTNKGRGSTPGRKVSEGGKSNMSKSKIGVSIPHPSNIVLQYDLKGNFIKEWSGGVNQIKTEIGITVSSAIRGVNKTSNGSFWRYKDNPLNLNSLEINQILTKSDKGSTKPPMTQTHKSNLGKSLKGRKCEWDTSSMRAKPITQYDLEGVLIQNFKSSREACLVLNFPSKAPILQCCRGKQNKAYGYIWEYQPE
jgi:group I intron endonuclease